MFIETGTAATTTETSMTRREEMISRFSHSRTGAFKSVELRSVTRSANSSRTTLPHKKEKDSRPICPHGPCHSEGHCVDESFGPPSEVTTDQQKQLHISITSMSVRTSIKGQKSCTSVSLRASIRGSFACTSVSLRTFIKDSHDYKTNLQHQRRVEFYDGSP